MNVYKIKTEKALDMLVCEWIQKFSNTHFRCISRLHHDAATGDEFLTVYDPETDRCITVWLSPTRFGNEVLELARKVLVLPEVNGKGGNS